VGEAFFRIDVPEEQRYNDYYTLSLMAETSGWYLIEEVHAKWDPETETHEYKPTHKTRYADKSEAERAYDGRRSSLLERGYQAEPIPEA
jgi:hypothetical protein